MLWLRQLKYRREILAKIMTIHFWPEKGFAKHLKHHFPGAFHAIQRGFFEGQKADELAVRIAGIILASQIEALDYSCRDLILEEVSIWAKTPMAIEDFWMQKELGTASDAFICRVKWAISLVTEMQGSGEIDKYCLDWFYSEIFGSLMGKCKQKRILDRQSHLLEKAFFNGEMRSLPSPA